MAKIKTYIATGVIWPEAAKALGAPSHVVQVNVYLAAPTKKAAEEYLLDLHFGRFIALSITKAARVNDAARTIRELRAAGHLDDLSVYVEYAGRYSGKVARATYDSFELLNLNGIPHND